MWTNELRRGEKVYREEWGCRPAINEDTSTPCKFGQRAFYDEHTGKYSCREFCKDTYYKPGEKMF